MNRTYWRLAAAACLLSAAPLLAEDWMINEDYQQRDARPATDFEIVLAGDVRGQITGGGQSDVTNPFPSPTRTIELTGIGNTKITFKGSGTIPQNLTANRHFGIFGTGKKPKVRFKAWSYATSPGIVPVPKSNFDYAYNPTTQELTVTIENLTEDTVTFGDVGYQLNPVERPIAELNRDYLPPHVFLPLMALSAEYLPGESRSALLSNVTPDMYIITYATTTFTGASAGNPYNEFGIGTGGEWAQAAVATQVSPVIPAASTSGLVILAVLLAIGGVAAFRRKGRSAAVASALLAGLFLIAPAYAWERGNHAGDWGKGATLKVCVDTPPGTPEQQAEFYEAVFEAIAEWNEAQAAFGGLTLEYTPSKNNCDVRIHWQANAPEWGSTAPGGPPVDVTIESNDGLNSRGVTRVLKHEFGHVEGLGHSANSDLMREDAYSSTPGTAPSADDLNSADPFTEPTADDLAGKKEMYGTVVEQSKSQTTSNATYNGALDIWQYIYELFALMGPTFVDPVTEFTIDLPPGVGPADFTVTQLPPGWVWEFHDGGVSGSGKQLDREEAHSPSLLRFKAPSPALGIAPGETATFLLTSPMAPTETRSFTNSPNHDTDESWVMAPGGTAIPAVSPQGLVGMAAAMLIGGALIFGRRRLKRLAA